ncbi:ABC transporter ATP-binding protein [Piscinibacter koreensis]|nr:ABC transporter ATP-binding protein [Schlegelella koreensis]
MSTDVVLHDLGKVYAAHAGARARTIFDGLGMTIRAGELVALVGPSGCGKSTLLNLVAGLDQPTRGRVEFARCRSDIDLGIVFQQPRLVDWLTVQENVSLVFERDRPPPGDARAAAARLLARVQLQDHASSYPQRLSGGQKQRVAIARAFAIPPDVLLLDEPFSALDELTARRLRLLLQELWLDDERPRPTGILVTHNMLEAAFLADRIVVMGGRPAHITAIIEVDVARPRDPDDPALFAVHRRVMQALAGWASP